MGKKLSYLKAQLGKDSSIKFFHLNSFVFPSVSCVIFGSIRRDLWSFSSNGFSLYISTQKSHKTQKELQKSSGEKFLLKSCS